MTMFYEGLAVAVVVLALLLLLLSLKVLIRTGWFLGWLRGMFGLVLTGGGVLLALTAYDVFSYQQILAEKAIATLSFEKLGTQRYQATLVDAEGAEQTYELLGDQWQLDARIIKWPGILSAWGVKPGYRLDRISGRYFSLAKERNGERSVYALSQSEFGIDVWAWLQGAGQSLPFVNAVYGSATFVPMDDGALYGVSLTSSGLIARPLNERAQMAVSRWQ
ncbi:MAG: hypothetical protein MI810_03860 [Flavobacteriales bacterium]|nr:hypothetical protein [Flavobacteriales bacterium]